MTFLIRAASGEIKTYMEIPAGTVLDEGETLEEIPGTLESFSKRLRLSVNDISGELVQVPIGGTAAVQVDCPGESSIALEINGLRETLPLVDGTGTLTLSLDIPGMFIIRPADRTVYCAAGEALCMVQVEEAE